MDDWIYCTLYIHTVQDYRQHSAIAILHTLQFTVTRALAFSVFTSRILATDLSQSHCNNNFTHEVFLAPSHSFLASSSQSTWTAIYRTRPNCLDYCSIRAGTATGWTTEGSEFESR
jgi:hypothetical protein